MKKINLTKYGFVRNPEKDELVEGTYYRCYTHPQAPNSNICKIVENGKLCLYSETYSPHLTYEEFQKIPYPKIFEKLEDILVSEVTDSDLKEFAIAVVEFDKKVAKETKKAVWPHISEVEELLREESYRFKRESIYASNMLKNNVDKIINNDDLLKDVKYFINRSKNFDIEKIKENLLKSRNQILEFLKKKGTFSSPTTDFVRFQKKLEVAGIEVF